MRGTAVPLTNFKTCAVEFAWIQNCMVEAGNRSLPTKVHPEKKPQSKKTRR
jgi:hypothetical protein